VAQAPPSVGALSAQAAVSAQLSAGIEVADSALQRAGGLPMTPVKIDHPRSIDQFIYYFG
jgi:hypothetical protein